MVQNDDEGYKEKRKVSVKNSSEFSQAIGELRPGTTLLLESGIYSGGIYLCDIEGKDGRPVVIEGTDPNNPPVFAGGSQAMHLANCSYITLRNIKVSGFPTNGINIDDGGSYETPTNNIVLENVTILETGPKGNHDALKMSGVDHFIVRKCRFEGWGGSGIDMVGCHHGIVEDCTFTGRPGFSQSNGVQLKGGTEDVLVQCCFFKNAGQRSINLGGSTGLQFFRPKVQGYEARNITVAGNRFVGNMAPVAWHDLDRYREPSLPVPETESIYLRDISIDRTRLADEKLELDDDRVKEIGAQAYKRAR